MKSIYRVTGIFMTVVAILALSGTAGFAKIATQSLLQNTDVFLLTQNHAREVAYDLNALVGESQGLHSIYVLGLNLAEQSLYSELKISVACNSVLVKGDEFVYLISGFFLAYDPATGGQKISPLFQYVYGTQGAFAVVAKVPKMTFGVLYTGIIYASNVDFPITLNTVITLTPVYAAGS